MRHSNETLAEAQIRLLRLEPAASDSPVVCSTVPISIHDTHSYEAVSYLWGDPAICEDIFCNGAALSVTTNAAQALRRFRQEDRVRYLWLDQVCINQSNVEERSQQVSIMFKIFGLATRVLMWLGPDEEGHAPVASAFLEELHLFHREPVRLGSSQDEFLSSANLPLRSSPKWAALKALVSLRYWTRVWMVQEVWLAVDALASWGHVDIPWLHIYRAASWGEDSIGLNLYYTGVVPKHECTLVRQMAKGSQSIYQRNDYHSELRWAVGLLAFRHATDPRDKIFAMLNVVDQHEREGLAVDYALSVVDVYKRVTEHLIFVLEHDLRTLQDASLSDAHPIHRGDRWPSWVPIWGNTPSTWIRGPMPYKYLVSAGTRSEARVEGDYLHARGLRVGTIRMQAYPWLKKHFLTLLHEMWSMVKQTVNTSISNEPAILQMLWTLLCSEADADIMIEQEQIRRELGWTFVRYLYFCIIYYGDDETAVEILESTVLALMGSLNDIFNPHNSAHAVLAENWRNAIKKQGLAPLTLQLVRNDLARARPDSRADESLVEHFACYEQLVQNEGGAPEHNIFIQAHDRGAAHHRFFVTQCGKMGMSPPQAQEGDIVVILFGASVPFILRPVSERFLLIGSAYCYGIMNGEYAEMLKANGAFESATETFVIQ